jgi:hypothetical protein
MKNDSAQESKMPTDAGHPPLPTPGPEDVNATMPGAEVDEDQGLLARLRAKLSTPRTDQDRETKTSERTRALVLLLGGIVACVLLFFALFTTDGGESRKDRKSKPNLGRPETSAVAEGSIPSPVPQLSVNSAQPEETVELTEKDLLATMRNRGPQVSVAPPPPVVPPSQSNNIGSVRFTDPALEEAYRKQGLTPPPPRTEATDWNAAIRDYQQRQAVAAPVPAPSATVPAKPALNDSLAKSSLVFVRTNFPTTALATSMSAPLATMGMTTRLPNGSALVARLQNEVNSAVKAPVVAVIEYNYERDSQLIVPAGSKAYGELSQATPQGWVTISFSELELPDGRRQKIKGTAVGMDRQMIRGDVNGKKTGIKVLTRALTGVGTIAAFAVGGRSANGGIDNSILLRERVASNVALAGEQQLAQLAYQQNIVVTVPARTQFYLVLQEEATVAVEPRPLPTVPPSPVTAAISDRELQELLQIRNEMREMNRMMQQSMQTFPRPEPQQQEEQ